MTDVALAPVELDDNARAIQTAAPAADVRAVPVTDWGRRIESAVRDQAADVRRFIVASLDSFATRIVSDVRGSMPAPAVEPPPAPAPPPKWPWAAGLAAASLVAVAFAASWLAARDELAKSRAEIAGLTSANAELQRART